MSRSRTGRTVAFALLFAVCTVAPLFARPVSAPKDQSAPLRHITVRWKRVAGATRYEMLIRPLGGDVIIDRKTARTSLPVVLSPGTYQVRVVSFNIFDRPASVTKWRYLEVIRVHRPIVASFGPKVLYAGVTAAELGIDGAKFLPETRVALVNDGNAVARAIVDKATDRRLQVHFDLASIPPGTYGLRLTNPEHLVVVIPRSVEVRPRIQPLLSAISLRHGYNDRVYRGVRVGGNGFVAGMSFFLSAGDRRIDINSAVVSSPSRASLDINLGDVHPGLYTLEAVDPGGLYARLPGALRVLNIGAPTFLAMKPRRFTIGTSSGKFEIIGRGLIADTRVFLAKNGVLIPTVHEPPATGHEVRGPSAEHFELELAGVRPGSYDLVIANSQTLRTVVPGEVLVRPAPLPALTAVSLRQGYDTRSYRDVRLYGTNLRPGYKVALARGTVVYHLVSRFVSPRELRFDIDMVKLKPGSYRLLVESSARVVASLPGGIEVVSPPERFIHPTTIRVTAGYPYSLLLGSSFANSLQSSFIGGDLVAAFPLGVKFFPKTPAIRDMGIKLEAGYEQYGPSRSTPPTSVTFVGLDRLQAGSGFYYRTPFNFPLNGILSVDYGIALSRFQWSGSLGAEQAFAESFYYKIGAAMEIDIGKRITTETGADWTRVLYAAANFDTLDLFVRAGVRLGR